MTAHGEEGGELRPDQEGLETEVQPEPQGSRSNRGRRFYLGTLALIVAASLVLIVQYSGTWLFGALHTSSESRSLEDSSEDEESGDTDPLHARPSVTNKTGETLGKSDVWAWENAGGQYGLTAEWQEAIMAGDGEAVQASLRGHECSSAENQKIVNQILQKRAAIYPTRKVAACVRSKDFGRFLPEWIAYHYVIGVDEIMIFDDNSVDRTRDILRPFLQTGILKYKFEELSRRSNQMKPLHECWHHYEEQRHEDETSPRWILLHDTDEYIYPQDTTLTVSDALQEFEDTCCVDVKRVQYGSSGFRKTPPGLMIEKFNQHASVSNSEANRLPKVVLNLDPTEPELGVVNGLPSMHMAKGCKCAKASMDVLRINHYLGSIGDYVDKTRRYWQENHSIEKVEKYMARRDINDFETFTIGHWACATREVLARVEEQRDIVTGLPIPADQMEQQQFLSSMDPGPKPDE